MFIYLPLHIYKIFIENINPVNFSIIVVENDWEQRKQRFRSHYVKFTSINNIFIYPINFQI